MRGIHTALIVIGTRKSELVGRAQGPALSAAISATVARQITREKAVECPREVGDPGGNGMCGTR